MKQEDLDHIDEVMTKHLHYSDATTDWRPYASKNAVVAVRKGKILHWIRESDNLAQAIDHYSQKTWCNKTQLIRILQYMGWLGDERE